MIILDFCSFSVRSGRAIDGFDFFFYQNFFQGRLRNTKAAHDFLKKFFRNENPTYGLQCNRYIDEFIAYLNYDNLLKI